MASKSYILEESKYCRDCGGPATKKWLESYCKNIEPKAVCKRLSRQERNYCEHCGQSAPGPDRCPNCLELPLDDPTWEQPSGRNIPLLPTYVMIAAAIAFVLSYTNYNRSPWMLHIMTFAVLVWMGTGTYMWYLRRRQRLKADDNLAKAQARVEHSQVQEDRSYTPSSGVPSPVPVEVSNRQEGNPKLKPCPDCNHQVSRLAPTCPKCGRPLLVGEPATRAQKKS